MYLCVCIVLLDYTKIKQTLDFGVAIETYELQENQSLRLTRDSRNNVFLENASKCGQNSSCLKYTTLSTLTGKVEFVIVTKIL
jgi:hypothetical protein